MDLKSIILVSSLAALVGTLAGYTSSHLNVKNRNNEANSGAQVNQRIAQLEQEIIRLKELNQTRAPVSPEQAPTPNSAGELPAITYTEELEEESVDDNVFVQAPTEAELANSLRDIKQTMLLENGFSQEEADWVLQNEAEADLDALYDTYNYRKAAYSEALKKGLLRKTDQERLRERLGDDYYERYLKANGMTTTPYVGQVIKGSPADNSGLKSGDRIRSYDGERVFSFRDITNLTLQGNTGETVLIEIERDGSPMQITLPRGPIGVIGERGR